LNVEDGVIRQEHKPNVISLKSKILLNKNSANTYRYNGERDKTSLPMN
jgi:hypothetical protein